jgi:AAA domain
MRADEVRGGVEATIEVRPKDGAFAPVPARRDEVQVRRVDDEVLLCWGQDRVLPVVGADTRAQAALVDAVESGLPLVVWVAFADAARAALHVRRFHGALRIEDPLTIGIDDRCQQDLRTRFGVGGTVADAAAWLEERLLLDGPAPYRRAVVSAGPQGSQEAFRMFGKGPAIDVRREDNRLRIERVLKGAPTGDAPIQLLVAPLSFADRTATGEIAAGARLTLEQAVRDEGSYLRIWSTYAEMERETLQRKARRVGSLRYDRCSRRSDGGFQFHLAEADDVEARFASLGDEERFELEAGETPPDLDKLDAPNGRQARHSAAVVSADTERRTVDLRAPDREDDEDTPPPPPQGFLYLSLVGNLVSLRRRESAEQRLRTGNCPLPQIGLLLENRPAPQATRRRQSPTSPAVLDAFGSRPTQKQLEAIDVALNTPDIALIQGPPGTGKTKVITALQRRIAELADEGAEVSHRILVTSAQHDAVENVVQRSEVFGLPAVKVGSRRGDDGAGIDGVEKFRRDRADHLRAALPEPPEAERAARARNIAVACLRAPTPAATTAAHLRELRGVVTGLIPPALHDRLERRIAELTRPPAPVSDVEDQELRLVAARGIRTMAESFLDDGPMKARKALVRLDALLLPEERELLGVAAAWVDPGAPPWLDRIGAMRDAILDRLVTPPPAAQPLTDEATQGVLVAVIDAIEQRRMRSIHGEPGVLAAYLHDLENDPGAVREALEHYTVVLAATCQQAAGGAMRAVRGIEEGSADFETVIVDEAARVSPLDLFIPISMAKRRVVLVGDHRQLPHMLEPEVERDVAVAVAKGDLAHEAQDALKASLFGRLWDALQDLEARDGIRRTVRLGTQFRMHPALGELVSRSFYDGKLDSGTKPEPFAHDLPGYVKDGRPCVAAWLDVPGGPGRAERRGRSKSRPAEAKRIAREVKTLIEADPRLTFGIIAFYKDQVGAIGEALSHEGLAARTDAGGWEIAERWRRTEDGRGERLRLGTVDSFQGKEFDVVFLSVTRSNDLPGETDEQRRRKYGHLLLANRLCVAMSRQHRLLIVAGDRTFAATEALAPLHAFSNLCGGPHGTARS